MGLFFFLVKLGSLSRFTMPTRPESTKGFECGLDSYETQRQGLGMKFYRVLLVFLIFDLEVVVV